MVQPVTLNGDVLSMHRFYPENGSGWRRLGGSATQRVKAPSFSNRSDSKLCMPVLRHRFAAWVAEWAAPTQRAFVRGRRVGRSLGVGAGRSKVKANITTGTCPLGCVWTLRRPSLVCPTSDCTHNSRPHRPRIAPIDHGAHGCPSGLLAPGGSSSSPARPSPLFRGPQRESRSPLYRPASHTHGARCYPQTRHLALPGSGLGCGCRPAPHWVRISGTVFFVSRRILVVSFTRVLTRWRPPRVGRLEPAFPPMEGVCGRIARGCAALRVHLQSRSSQIGTIIKTEVSAEFHACCGYWLLWRVQLRSSFQDRHLGIHVHVHFRCATSSCLPCPASRSSPPFLGSSSCSSRCGWVSRIDATMHGPPF